MNTEQQNIYMKIELDRVKKIAELGKVKKYNKRNNIDYILLYKTNAGYSLSEVKKHNLNYHVFTTNDKPLRQAFIYADYLKLRLLDTTEETKHTLYFTENKEIEYDIVQTVDYINYVVLQDLQNINLNEITSTFYMKATEKESAKTAIYAFNSCFFINHNFDHYFVSCLGKFCFNVKTYESAVQMGLNALCATIHGYELIV